MFYQIKKDDKYLGTKGQGVNPCAIPYGKIGDGTADSVEWFRDAGSAFGTSLQGLALAIAIHYGGEVVRDSA